MLPSRSRRVCIIGLDGLGLNNAIKFMEAGCIPTISSIINYSSSTPISMPPYTPPAWTSIFTGVNPGKHSVVGYLDVKRSSTFIESIRLTSSFSVRYPRIFEMAAMYGLKSVVVGVPFTYPFRGVIGRKHMVIVTEWPLPIQGMWPKTLSSKYREYLVKPPRLTRVDVDEYIEKLYEYTRARTILYEELLENIDWSFYIVVFSELDRLMHKVPSLVVGEDINKVYKVLRLIDDFVRKALHLCDLMVLVSDHGFTIKKLYVNVNSLLYNYGLCRYNLALKSKTSPYMRKYGVSSCSEVTRNLVNIVFRNSMLRRLASKIPRTYLLQLLRILPIKAQLNLSSSIAIATEAPWAVYVRKGYSRYVAKLLRKLPGVSNVWFKEEKFHGEYLYKLPEVIIEFKSYVNITPSILTPIYRKTSSIGHSKYALLAIKGDAVDLRLNNSSSVELFDIVPTVLSYLRLPIPHDTDGKTLLPIDQYREFNYSSKYRVLKHIVRTKYEAI